MKEIKQLLELRKALELDCSYNEANKKFFATKSKTFLKLLAKELGLKDFKVTYNKGGVAVAGDPRLMGMWDDDNGIYVAIDGDRCFGGTNCMFRTIKHMNDYTGGYNQWLNLNITSMEDIIDTMKYRCMPK